MAPETRTLTLTHEDADGDEITGEWLAGIAEGLEEERDDLPPGTRITRVDLTLELPDSAAE